MRTLLLYNPVSGRNRGNRPRLIDAIAALFAARGHATAVLPTTGPGSAANQTRVAISQGVQLVVACGGDGTIHDVLQGLIDPAHPQPRATLGVIPMGSANALARHLGLSTDPLTAAGQLLTFTPRIIPVGQIATTASSRYFTVLAGAGPSGALVYPGEAAPSRIFPAAKHRLGRLAYYLHAATLFLTEPFPAFELSWVESDDFEASLPGTRTIRAIGIVAVRIQSLGGLFHPLAPAAAVDHPFLSLVIIRPPGWLGLPAWFAGSWLGQRHRTPLVAHARVSEFTITPAPGSRPIHLQADGEWIGTAPARVRLIPGTLQLLMPPLGSG